MDPMLLTGRGRRHPNAILLRLPGGLNGAIKCVSVFLVSAADYCCGESFEEAGERSGYLLLSELVGPVDLCSARNVFISRCASSPRFKDR